MRRCFLLGLLLAFAVSRLAPQTPPASHFDGKSWWAHVKFLADDALAGRNTGSEGLRKAEAYAVEHRIPIEPAVTATRLDGHRRAPGQSHAGADRGAVLDPARPRIDLKSRSLPGIGERLTDKRDDTVQRQLDPDVVVGAEAAL